MIKNYVLIPEADVEGLKLEDLGEFNDDEVNHFIYCKGYYDKEFFSRYFLSHWKSKKTPAFHSEIHEVLTGKAYTGEEEDEEIEDHSEDEAVAVVCPRGHGKTTTITIDMMHAICYKIYGSQLYIATSGLGEETLGKMREEFESNEKIRDVFGDLVPRQDKNTKEEFGAKKWRMKHMELLNGEMVETLTAGQSVRGKRPKRIVVDDFDENKDVQNKSIVEKRRIWFFTSLYNTLLPGGKIVVLGTIVGNMCLVKHLRDDKKWRTIEYAAINNGQPLWEDMWSIQKLNERKSKIGTPLFNQEFMNIPLSVETRLIKEEWIKFYDYTPENFDEVIMAIDPASETKEENDFTGFSVVGRKDENYYVLYAKGHKLSPLELPKMCTMIYNKYQPELIVFEKNKESTMGVLLKANYNLPLELYHAHKDKRTRLLSIAGKIEFGKVFFSRRHEELIDQLTNFPDVEHDDVMDAFVYCLMFEGGGSYGAAAAI